MVSEQQGTGGVYLRRAENGSIYLYQTPFSYVQESNCVNNWVNLNIFLPVKVGTVDDKGDCQSAFTSTWGTLQMYLANHPQLPKDFKYED